MSGPLQQYPFARVWVDHLVHGVTRVWWRHHPNFTPAGTVYYQLQLSQTGAVNATDWANVGSPVANAAVLEDRSTRLQGKKSRQHYRVLVTDAAGTVTGVSLPVGTWGLLDERAWLLSREVLRQFEVSHRLTTRPGFLLKRMRSGPIDQNAVHPLTGAVLDSRRPQSMGTEFEIGYFPPIPSTCMDLTPQDIEEDVSDDGRGSVRDMAGVVGFTTAFPQMDHEDVWVDARSDDRWSVQRVKNEIEVRGVPLVCQVQLVLLPKSHVVYKVPVDAASTVPTVVTKRGPTQLANPVKVNHNFGGPDSLAYVDGNGNGIIGAKILLFTKAAYDSGLRGDVSAIATSQTGAAGRWMADIVVDPGPYVIVFEKQGEYGTNHYDLVVNAPL